MGSYFIILSASCLTHLTVHCGNPFKWAGLELTYSFKYYESITKFLAIPLLMDIPIFRHFPLWDGDFIIVG